MGSDAAPVVVHASPHPDDELLGAGAALMALRDAGWRVVNVACSLGRPDDRDRRRAELAEACRRAGFELELPGGLPAIGSGQDAGAGRRALAPVLAEAIERHGASLIAGPSIDDPHPGHATVGWAIRDAVQSHGVPLPMLLWSLWGELRAPNAIFGFGGERLSELQAALSAHGGELARSPFDRLLRARAELAAVRGPELVFGFGASGRDHEYAELLEELTWERERGFVRGAPRVWAP